MPGSVAQRQLLNSFSRMLPELLRYSSAHTLLEQIPDELKNAHRQDQPTVRDDSQGEVFVNTAKNRAIARADKKMAARGGNAGPSTAVAPSAASGEAPVLDLWGDIDADTTPFLDLGDNSLSSLGL